MFQLWGMRLVPTSIRVSDKVHRRKSKVLSFAPPPPKEPSKLRFPTRYDSLYPLSNKTTKPRDCTFRRRGQWYWRCVKRQGHRPRENRCMDNNTNSRSRRNQPDCTSKGQSEEGTIPDIGLLVPARWHNDTRCRSRNFRAPRASAPELPQRAIAPLLRVFVP